MKNKFLFFSLLFCMCLPAQAEWFLRGTHNAWAASQMESAGAGINTMQLKGVVFTAAGNVKFDRFGDWTESYGVGGKGGSNIPVAAGTWDIKFFTDTKTWNITAPQVAAAYHVRGTNNGWLEGTLMNRVGTTDAYELCVNFVAGDASGGPRFKIDPNGGWGDGIPASDVLVSAGWVKILFDSASKAITTQQNLAANCGAVTSRSSASNSFFSQSSSSSKSSSLSSSSSSSSSLSRSSSTSSSVVSSTAASIYHVRGTFNGWLEGTLMNRIGTTDNYELCVNFAGGDTNGGPRFKIDPNGGWGDGIPAADFAVTAGWVKISFNSVSKVITTQQNLAASCAATSAASVSSRSSSISVSSSSSVAPASIYHVRGTFNGWLEGTLMNRVGSTDNYERCVNFAGGDSNGGPRFKIDPNGGWGDGIPAGDFVVTAGWVKILFNSTSKAISVQQNLPFSCGNLSSESSTSSSVSSASAIFDSALWRLMSRQDRSTLTRNSETNTLNGDDYHDAPSQQWRIFFENGSSSNVNIKHEETQKCLAVVNNAVSLADCNVVSEGVTKSFVIETLRKRTEAQPAIYLIHVDSLRCILPNSTSVPFVSACGDSARWYIEPVGYGERALGATSKYDVKGLLIVKPLTQVNDLEHGLNAQGAIPQDIVDAAQVSFKAGVKFWLERITDGQVTWSGESVVANEPIRSLSYGTTSDRASGSTWFANPISGESFFWNKLTNRFEPAGLNFDSSQFGDTNFLPADVDLPNDVQRFVPRGMYDTVQVFFTGGSVPGGWGWGPGRSAQSNYTLWTTINGGATSASQWLSKTYSEPTEVFIHEMMHGFDSHYDHVEGVRVPLEEDYLHGAGTNKYGSAATGGWIHWYRDIWLGTVIGSDDTYRGYGPRMFKLDKVRNFAAAQPVSTIKITQNTSGKCLSTKNGVVNPVAGTEVVFSSVCNTDASSFLLQANGMLEFKGGSVSGTGFCVHPVGGTPNVGSHLVLWPACADAGLPVQITDQGAIQNISSGLCVHPDGGAAIPADGTNAVYWSGCEHEVLRYKFNRY